MPLKDEAQFLIKQVRNNEGLLKTNEVLLDIYEGELLKYIEDDLADELSLKSFFQAKPRIAPINTLQRIVSKLAQIYQTRPARNVVGDSSKDSDSELLKWYEKKMRVNHNFNISNEYYNIYKNALWGPFVHMGEPMLQIVPSDRFIPIGMDPIDPLRMTHLVILYSERNENDETTTLFHIYTDDEFIVVDSKNRVRQDIMLSFGNPDGVNPYGKIPFTYINKSTTRILPKPDSDQLRMTKLIPILLSDLNFAAKFQTFSIVYGIDITSANLEMSPNAMWELKSDPNTEKNPEIGTIKPQVDIDKALTLISTQLAFWLNSKGIRPGSIGELTQNNFASGISKMVDEMDTSDERQKQTEVFGDSEAEFWDLLLKHMHPVWVRGGLIENRTLFTESSKVVVNFAPQVPMLRRGDMVKELKLEVEAGFMTRKDAIKRLNPKLSDSEVEDLIREIDEENAVELEPVTQMTEEGRTSVSDNHTHSYTIDQDGNGQTDVVDGHMHDIVNRVVQESDGHTHGLAEG